MLKVFVIFCYRIRDKELSIEGQEPHLGHEGKYRRTSSPSVCNAPNVKPSLNAALNSNKSKAKTPKRDSPATIAAKGKTFSNLKHKKENILINNF